MSACSGCGATIWWAVVEGSGERIPCDPHDTMDGTLVIVGKTGRGPVVRVLATSTVRELHSGQQALFDLEWVDRPRYLPHFVSCPHAESFRRPPAPAPARHRDDRPRAGDPAPRPRAGQRPRLVVLQGGRA